MKFDDFKPLKSTSPKIGGLIPEKQLTLLHGIEGAGKSYSLIKFLNENGITPIWIDFDENDDISELDYTRVDGVNALHALLDGDLDDASEDMVLIVDTYSRLVDEMPAKYNDSEISSLLLELSKRAKATVVIIGHSEVFAGKPTDFQDDKKLKRDAHAVLWLEYKLLKGAYCSNLHVKKVRGYTGKKIISNWMRD